MSPDDPPLLDLFTRLRAAGLPLGMDEYLLALRALQGGFGVGDRADLRWLCRTLWVKSPEDAPSFEHQFDLVMAAAPSGPATRGGERETADEEPDRTPPPAAPAPEPPVRVSASPSAVAGVAGMDEDEIAVAQAVRRAASAENAPIPRFLPAGEYAPVTRRQMKQSWRHLRRLVREGPATELDIEGTIRKVAREGILLEPVLVPRRVNRAELLLLLDQDGSMVPFHALSRRLAETAARGGRLGGTGVRYFHNCPEAHLYRDPAHQEAEPLSEILTRLRPARANVLIFSDAGAARGGFSADRLALTRAFLARLRGSVQRVAWLNPMPRSRWPGTTAGEIARLVPMSELSRYGLERAIAVLRGRGGR